MSEDYVDPIRDNDPEKKMAWRTMKITNPV